MGTPTEPTCPSEEARRMSCSGTKNFVRPDRYRANFPDAELQLHFTGQGSFKARLTHVELPHIRLLKAEENLPRIAYLSLGLSEFMSPFR